MLAGLGFAIWWFAYYNNSNKVLSDAFYNALSTTEGTSDVKISAKVSGGAANVDANIKVKYNKDAVSADIDGKLSAAFMSVGASANFVATKDGEVYIRVNDLEKLLKNFNVDSSALGGFDISKVSDKWIKISSEDLTGILPQTDTEADDSARCLENVLATVTDKRDVQKEILNAITSSKLLTAKRVGSDKDGIKFRLTGDLGNSREFAKAILSTELYKSIGKCSDEKLPTTADLDDVDWDQGLAQIDQLRDNLGVEIYFWVGTWGHQPTRLQVNIGVDDPNIDLTMDVTRKSGKTTIEIPKDSTSITSIIKDLQDSYTSPYDFPVNYNDYEESYDYSDFFKHL